MNRVGLVVDMSHSADRSAIEAADVSTRPIAITHANPHVWSPALRNKTDDVIRAVTENDGMFGFSLYPHHLRGGTACTLQDFCEMIARSADRFGVAHLGVGTGLCQDQPTAWSNGCASVAGQKTSITAKARPRPPVSRQCQSGFRTTETLATSKSG